MGSASRGRVHPCKLRLQAAPALCPALAQLERVAFDPGRATISRIARSSVLSARLGLTQQYRHLHGGAEHGSHTRCHRHGNDPPERYAQRTFKKRRAAHGRGGSAKQGQEDNRRRYDPIEQALLRRQ